jgi:hypothetical protein
VTSTGTSATSGADQFTYVTGYLTAPHMHPPGPSTVVKDTEPTFHWTRVAGATSYELVVTDITPGIDTGDANRRGLAHVLDESGLTGTTFTLPFTLNPGHYYAVEVRASNAGSQVSEWSNEPKFKIAEQKSRYFRIRLDKTLELSGGANYGRFVFTIQALTDSEGRDALGPPRILIFRGPGLTVPNPIPIGISGESTWDDFTTPTPMTVDHLAGGGGMTLYPSISLPLPGPLSGTDTRMTLAFTKHGRNFTQTIQVNSSGFGITLLTTYVGVWEVLRAPEYDPSLWPNTVVP